MASFFRSPARKELLRQGRGLLHRRAAPFSSRQKPRAMLAAAAATAAVATAATASWAAPSNKQEESVPFDSKHYGALGLNGRFLQSDAIDFFAGSCCEGGHGKFEDPELRELARPEVHAAILQEFQRHGIGLGDKIIDVGAGTGLFLESLANFVGPTGFVQAIDITPSFIDFMRERVRTVLPLNIRERIGISLCTPKSTGLSGASSVPGSTASDATEEDYDGQSTLMSKSSESSSTAGGGVQVPFDAAFICDVYHHFEYPKTFMCSLAAALRPGGIVVMVDFYRDPDRMVTHDPQWALSHLRAGRHEFLKEILDTDAFELVSMPDLEGLLQENYCLVFKRRLPRAEL